MRRDHFQISPRLTSLALGCALGMGLTLIACATTTPEGGGPVDTAQLRYVGKSTAECATIRFVCQPGEQYFANKEGCGCEVGEDPGGVPAQEGGMEGGEAPATEGGDDDGEGAETGEGADPGAAVAGDPVVCTPESRKAELCAEIYQPVCGYFDPKQVQCIKAPCAATYSNDCDACRDAKVSAYTPGECAP